MLTTALENILKSFNKFVIIFNDFLLFKEISRIN